MEARVRRGQKKSPEDANQAIQVEEFKIEYSYCMDYKLFRIHIFWA